MLRFAFILIAAVGLSAAGAHANQEEADFKQLVDTRDFLKVFMTPAARPQGPRRELNDNEKAIISTAIRDTLKDPDSANFKLPSYAGAAVYCGYVNAKNSYGGYDGFTLFIMQPVLSPNGEIQGVTTVQLYQQNSKFERMLPALTGGCRGLGY
jgi:hypothetical protein